MYGSELEDEEEEIEEELRARETSPEASDAQPKDFPPEPEPSKEAAHELKAPTHHSSRSTIVEDTPKPGDKDAEKLLKPAGDGTAK